MWKRVRFAASWAYVRADGERIEPRYQWHYLGGGRSSSKRVWYSSKGRFSTLREAKASVGDSKK